MSTLSAAVAAHKPSAGPALVRGLAPALLIVALPLLMYFYVGPWAGPFLAKLLIDVGIAIVMAVSLNIVNGFTGQFSIGHAGFMAVGAYTAAAITYYGAMLLWGDPAQTPTFIGRGEWLLCAGCVGGALVAAVLGYVVGLPSLRLHGDYLAIVTLGFGEIIRVLLQQTKPQLYTLDELKEAGWRDLVPPPFGGALGFSELPPYANLFWVYLFAVLTLAICFRIKYSSVGRAFLSIREDEVAARAMGVDITRLKVRAFILAAFFAGIAGGLFAHSGVILSPKDAGFQRSFEAVIMVVLGGMGSISGATVAAIILTLLPEILRDPTIVNAYWLQVSIATAALLLVAGIQSARRAPWRVWIVVASLTFAPLVLAWLADLCQRVSNINLGDYRLILYALLLIIMMIARPQGLFGVHELWELLRARRAAAPAGACK